MIDSIWFFADRASFNTTVTDFFLTYCALSYWMLDAIVFFTYSALLVMILANPSIAYRALFDMVLTEALSAFFTNCNSRFGCDT
jgi:hypothetical protein